MTNHASRVRAATAKYRKALALNRHVRALAAEHLHLSQGGVPDVPRSQQVNVDAIVAQSDQLLLTSWREFCAVNDLYQTAGGRVNE